MFKIKIFTILYVLFSVFLSPNLYAADSEAKETETNTETASQEKAEEVKTILIKEDANTAESDEEKPSSEESETTEEVEDEEDEDEEPECD